MRQIAPLVLLLVWACSDGSESGLDATVPVADTGLSDAGTLADAESGADAGLSPDAAELDGAALDADLPPPDAGSTTHPPVVLPAGRVVNSAQFSTFETCAACHANSPSSQAMRDASGQAIGPIDLWQSSMKANATRDPFFRAVMSAEILATPAAQAVIEAKCLTCHAPMGRVEAVATGQVLALDDLYVDSDLSGLALDGVSCTACHQITPEGLGTPQSFSGHFVMGAQRQIFGPHARPFTTPMVNRSGFTPVQSAHLQESSLCASCHTLHTDAVDADGAATGDRLPEQTPYLEWRNSSFTTEGAAPGPEAQSCQGCHMPTTDEQGQAIQTVIARSPNGGDFGQLGPRQPYGRHVLVGGNTLVPAMLRDNAAELNPKAPSAAFDATIARARRQLNTRTAALSVVGVQPQGALRKVTVGVENLAGHKLPTAYPSRRVWLRLSVLDGAGQVVYETGGYDARGRLVGPDGSVLPSELAGGPWLAHRDQVDDPAAPQVWQSVMGDGDGNPAFTLLRGSNYQKDNRILPRGWRMDGPDAAETMPVGVDGDASFMAGADQVTVLVPAPPAGQTHQVQVELLYQVISPRWAAELFLHDTAEVAAFRRYWEQADVRPELLAAVQAELR